MKEASKKRNLRRRIAFPLFIWGGINMLISSFFLFSSSELLKGVLTQAFFWGLIDAILGLVAINSKKELNLEKIKRILLVNTYLDVLYVIIGILLIILGISIGIYVIGNGYGIIFQGVFLFIVDLIHHSHVKNILKLKKRL